MFGLPQPPIELGIAISVLVLGGAIAFAWRAPVVVACAIVAVFALFHGYAHGSEIPSLADTHILLEIGFFSLSAAQLGGVLDLIGSGEISGKMAKDLFEILWVEGGDPAAVAAARGMKQVTDTGAIEAAVDAMIAANPDQVEKARANPKLAGWFTGQVLKATGGKANPAVVNEMVARKLGV